MNFEFNDDDVDDNDDDLITAYFALKSLVRPVLVNVNDDLFMQWQSNLL